MSARADKTNLLELDRTEMEEWITSLGQRAFHGRQLHAWIHRRGIFAFEEMTDLSKELRALLEEAARIPLPRLLERASGEGGDSATKLLLELEDGEQVETVLIPGEEKTTLCVSSQVGCAFGCTFCATGLLGLRRNMTAGEIVGTFLVSRRESEQPITNVVFMGMGEPLANLEPVLDAWRAFTDPDGIALSKRKVTISTVGLPDKVRRLASEPDPPKLVFSIASPHDDVRQRVLPVAGRFSLQQMHEALEEYAARTRHRITVALLVAKDFNDRPEDARALHRWIGNLPVKVNLLRYNEATGPFRRADEEKVEALAAELAGLGRTVILRRSRGRDVAAACGQLAARQVLPEQTGAGG